MIPGSYIAVISHLAASGLLGRYKGWEVRDTFLVLVPGPTNFFVHLLRVPLEESTIVEQVLKTGTGAINVEACRVGAEEIKTTAFKRNDNRWQTRGGFYTPGRVNPENAHIGRWPPNLLLIHAPECSALKCVNDCPASLLDLQGEHMGSHASGLVSGFRRGSKATNATNFFAKNEFSISHGYGYETMGVSRFFPQFKDISEMLTWINHLINPAL